MKQHIKKIELICNNFNIQPEELNKVFNHVIQGNLTKKIDTLFQKHNSKIIKANSHLIKGETNKKEFLFNTFEKNFQTNAGATWDYIYKGLFFLGLVPNRTYSDKKIEEGIIINELIQFNTLEEYLSSSICYKKIMSNFQTDSDWFKKIIAGAICVFGIENNFASKIFSEKTINLCSQNKSRYSGLFEYLTIISQHKNNIPLTKDEIKELNDFSDKIKNQNKEEIQEALSEKSKEAKKISNLRSQFSNSIDLEFKSFLKTQEKDMQHVISEYAKTFDLNIEMTATDKAHIIPVWYLVKEKRWDDIKNPNNGLILDPNTHRLFDKDKTTTLKDNRIFNDYHEFVIDKRFINPERRKFMDEWIENKGIFE